MLLAFRREQGGSQAGPQIVNLRCPVCNQIGSFHPFAGVHDFSWLQKAKSDEGGSTTYAGGVRICPNTECNAVVFVVAKGSNLIRSFPAQVLDFDSTNLPPRIKDSLTEAVKCHSAECYKASALMVRRTLESVRRVHAGLHSFLSMSLIEARWMKEKALRFRHSQSLASLRQRLSHAMVRSTIHRLGSTMKPLA